MQYRKFRKKVLMKKQTVVVTRVIENKEFYFVKTEFLESY